jgi:GT2 family glycosyltransferase
VVTFNSASTIARLLESLEGEPAASRVLILDNASDDDTLEVIRTYARTTGLRMEVFASAENVGFPAACNELLARVTEDVVVVLNPDIELRPGVLDDLATLVRRDPAIGIATCQLRTRDGRPQGEPARPRVTLAWVAASNAPRIVRQAMRRIAGRDRNAELARERDVGCCMGSFMVFRRELLDTVGYLDESLFMYL